MEKDLGSTVGKAIWGSKIMSIPSVFDLRDREQKLLRGGCRLEVEILLHTRGPGFYPYSF